MTVNYQNLLNAIINHIIGIWQNLNVEGNGFIEGILSLPKGEGYFVISLLPAVNWTRDNLGPVRLLFSLDNLYCIGFQRNVNWFIFSDHYMDIEESLRGTTAIPLNFSGNYNNIGANFTSINLGLYALFETYKGIAGFPGSLIKGPLLVSSVTFSEAIRFPRFRLYMFNRMSLGTSVPENIETFSDHFTNWSIYCRLIRLGRGRFSGLPTSGIYNFNDLLGLVGIIL
ncbi:hypothetical protein BRADI_2g39115v3 [Brachypodium distachyon]|uniref:rRNA N-glycosylase n=1 Tax=Brachypodium distachyon TaxID=15368 RepID=A0A2K2DCS6_BRADI|nr:hypothetical protein BRADI_2g39115v3 [Brachypodium distachyon]